MHVYTCVCGKARPRQHQHHRHKTVCKKYRFPVPLSTFIPWIEYILHVFTFHIHFINIKRAPTSASPTQNCLCFTYMSYVIFHTYIFHILFPYQTVGVSYIYFISDIPCIFHKNHAHVNITDTKTIGASTKKMRNKKHETYLEHGI